MRTMMRSLVFCFLIVIVIPLSSPLTHAQDLSKYRNFSFGMTVADLSKQIDRNPASVAVLHERPALVQELLCRPPQSFCLSPPTEPADQILFSFYHGVLYRM